jgi:ketosteroid isomerase-like protein
VVGADVRVTAAATFTTAQPAPPRCSMDDWRRLEQQDASAQDAFQRGDAEPIMALWPHAEDVTLFGALAATNAAGPPLGAACRQAARMNRSGACAAQGRRCPHNNCGADLALIIRIEHIPNSGAGAGVGAVTHLRVTHAARCESGGWRIVNRHADPLVENQVPKGLIPRPSGEVAPDRYP